MEKSSLEKRRGENPSLRNGPYMKSQVDAFWSSSDEKKKRAAADAAWLEKRATILQSSKKRLPKDQRILLECPSASELGDIMEGARVRAWESRERLRISVRKRDRADRGITRFLDRFDGYVKTYSGVIQLMSGAGAPYGEVAYGALSLFLVKVEDHMEKMLTVLEQEYCRIQMVKMIYNTDRIKEKTALLYRLGIEFLGEAARYYSIGPLRKLCYVVRSPPGMDLTNKVEEIKSAIEEMAKEMEMLDGIRLEKIERATGDTRRDVVSVKQEIRGLQERIRKIEPKVESIANELEALHMREDEKRLQSLAKALHLSRSDFDVPVNDYHKLLVATFDGLRRCPPFDMDKDLVQNPKFHAWCHSPESQLFLLHGSTVAPEQTLLSWVSSAAVILVKESERMFRDSQTLMLCCFCRTMEGFQTSKVPTSKVLANLLYQLMTSTNGKLLLRDDNLYAATVYKLSELDAGVPTRAPQSSGVFEILNDFLDKINVKKLIIIVDRVDQIEGDLETFFGFLLELSRREGWSVKIFLTLRDLYCETVTRLRGEFGEKTFADLRLDQVT